MLHTTPQERLALGVVALLVAAGAGVRLATERPAPEWRSGGVAADTPPDGPPAALEARVDEELRREEVRRTPLEPGETIDLNRASAEEIERLPRVGPSLAARIVERREETGPFRTLADLDALPGVGPAMLAALAPHLDLPAGAAGGAGAVGGEPVVDLNRATAAELEALPGVGPALATRIVAWREERGPFRSLEALEEVPGIGPSLRARLAPRLRVEP